MTLLRHAVIAVAVLVLATVIVPASKAETDKGIVSTVVNSPLSAAGTVRDAKVGINVYLQKPSASDSVALLCNCNSAILQFTAGSLTGKYRPTLALLNDPKNPAGGDSSRYTYTIVVE